MVICTCKIITVDWRCVLKIYHDKYLQRSKMHVSMHHSIMTRLISKECMREYLEVCEVTSCRRACQVNVKQLTQRKNIRTGCIASSYIHMQLSMYPVWPPWFFSTNRKKHMDDSRNNICNAGSDYCCNKQ